MRDELIDMLTAKLGDRMNECDELRKSNSQLIALNERLSKLIARIASGFKGEPAPDVTHSWHDLPALADLAGQMLKDWPAVWETIVIAAATLDADGHATLAQALRAHLQGNPKPSSSNNHA